MRVTRSGPVMRVTRSDPSISIGEKLDEKSTPGIVDYFGRI